MSMMSIATYIQEIGARDHKLAMRDLKPLSELNDADHDAFWSAWRAIMPSRRDEITQAMVTLAEDNVDLDFRSALFWMLDDENAVVRAQAIEGLWEDTSSRVLRKLLTMLQSDPAPDVRADAARALSRFAYQAALGELGAEQARALRAALISMILDQRQPLDVRRRSLESAGYFADTDDLQREIALAYQGDEQLLRESALVAMGRSMLPDWLPMIGAALGDVSPALRYEAARAAGEMAEEARSLVPRLLPLVDDDDTEVAVTAIWALGQIGGDAARRALQRVRKGQDETRGQAAAEALDEFSLDDSLIG
jgi:HEAT repeat protein